MHQPPASLLFGLGDLHAELGLRRVQAVCLREQIAATCREVLPFDRLDLWTLEEDGTLLRENDYIGRLHFNNASIAALGEGSMHRVGFRFAKLMRESLRKLAEAAHNDPAFADVRVFQGTTWIPSHGEVVGFVSTPLPKSWKTWLLSAHFKMLMWVFAPSSRIRGTGTWPARPSSAPSSRRPRPGSR